MLQNNIGMNVFYTYSYFKQIDKPVTVFIHNVTLYGVDVLALNVDILYKTIVNIKINKIAYVGLSTWIRHNNNDDNMKRKTTKR